MKKTERNDSYSRVLSALNSKRVIIIQGLRRIGKTRVMNTLRYEERFKGFKIKDFFVGEFGQDDEAFAKGLIEEAKKEKNRSFLILVDEFQKLDRWQDFFFTLHRIENVTVVATGSVSANSDLISDTEGGRFFYISMFPLSFNEFREMASGVGRTDEEEFMEYATMGSYPEQEFSTDIKTYKRQVSDNIIEKTKNVTLLKSASLDNPDHVNKVLLYLVDNVGNTISDNSISTSLQLDVRTVGKILSYLKQSFLIYEVANSKQGKGKAGMSNRKYYLTDHTFFLFVKQCVYGELDAGYQARVFENIIFNAIKQEFNRDTLETRFEINKQKHIDIDLVILKDDKKRLIEIKNSESKDSLTSDQKKIKNLTVIYKGKTEKIADRQWINYIDFIKEVKKWI